MQSQEPYKVKINSVCFFSLKAVSIAGFARAVRACGGGEGGHGLRDQARRQAAGEIGVVTRKRWTQTASGVCRLGPARRHRKRRDVAIGDRPRLLNQLVERFFSMRSRSRKR
jgi:hypothetical protein